jgi:hypothetical protein
MIDFRNKNILFLTSSFFNYEIDIKNKLESLGAKVYLFDERPSNNPFVKAIIRIGKSYIERYLDRYYEKICQSISLINFDYVLIIKGETITRARLSSIRQLNPNAKFILYMWDSIENYPHIQDLISEFDKALSFDENDSNQFPDFKFRPLFYIDTFDISKYSYTKDSLKYDLLFVGTVHSDRWLFLNKIRYQAEQQHYKVFYYPYIQSPVVFVIRKLFDKRLRTLSYKEVKFRPLSKEKVAKLMLQSKVILDIQHPQQTGLTMRTLEVFGMQKKLFTTNKEIIKYDLYNKKNIAVIDRVNPIIHKSIFDSEYELSNKNIIDKYSFEGWLNDIFDVN